mgnify:CR=1 FL=1
MKPRFDFTLQPRAAESFFMLLERMREQTLRRISKTDFVKMCLIEGMQRYEEKMKNEGGVLL